MSALQAGVKGMLAHQVRMDAIGNNIANVNTTGYKSLRVNFADALYQSLNPATAPTDNLGGTNPDSVGQGVLVAGVDVNFGQGDLQSTGRTTDIAIEGEGFLAVTDGERILYTRNGALGLDRDGHLVHLASGLRVVAVPPASNANSLVSVTPTSTVQVLVGRNAVARATTSLSLGGNLDSRLLVGGQHRVTFRAYDSLGADHELTVTFTRSATNGQWDVAATSPDGAVTIGPPAQVTFDDQGLPTVTGLPLQLTLANPNGANANVATTLSLSGVTQLAQESSAALRAQDGVPPGTLNGLAFNTDGAILGVYSNGLTSAVGQLVTAVFANVSGLENQHDSLYAATVNSGEPSFGIPGTNGRGAARSGQLEASNVNLTEEFGDMILTQRGFQANSRVVTTADQMLQEVMNIVR